VAYVCIGNVKEMLTNVGDVGGQKTLRSYWRNYFEKTDALIWVVDATDRLRIDDCRDELSGLLQEEVQRIPGPSTPGIGANMHEALSRCQPTRVCK
jgi:GTPase SAR1 family protein